MSEWVRASLCKPPESHSVLLYVVTYHENGKDVWDDSIYVGFYGDKDWDRTGFWIESISTDGEISHHPLIESETLKVLAWTLLPRKPYKEVFIKNQGISSI